MPHKSLREIRADLRRLRTERFIDALLVVESHEGEELFRCGGQWDKLGRRYTGKAARPHVVHLKESQLDAGRDLARWLEQSRRGDPDRPIVLMLAGDRGSGKTWFLGLIFVVCAIEWPCDFQFGVNLTAAQRLECIEAIDEISAPGWVASHPSPTNLRDPWTVMLTGGLVGWLSAKNPKRLRQAKLRIRHVAINEAQDQPERIYHNAVGATRNVDGLTSIATNRPQDESGDWVTSVADAIDEGTLPGTWRLLDAKKNDAVDQHALDKRYRAMRAVSREAAEADAGGGGMRLSGPIAFPGFRPLPWEKGGHVGSPPEVGWQDVTREITAEHVEGSAGWPYVCGVDFQRRPGIIGNVGKLYRARELDGSERIVLAILSQVCTEGEETAFSEALFRRGYEPQANSPTGILIIGDGTGARQNARHKWSEPTSFAALKTEGWLVLPPCYTRRNRKPDNPLVKESLPQMHLAFERRQIMIAPSLREPEEGFAALVESFRRAKKTPRGALVEKGGWQHGPDGVRGLAWRFLPRPQPPKAPGGIDDKTFDALAGIRVLTS